MNFDSYDEFRSKRAQHRQRERLKVPYRGNNDVFTDHRHRFVRRMQKPSALYGPYSEKPPRNNADRIVIASCVLVAVVAALLVHWGVVK